MARVWIDIRPEFFGDEAEAVLQDLAAPALVGFDPSVLRGVIEVADAGGRARANDF
jgi:hypothetical protein